MTDSDERRTARTINDVCLRTLLLHEREGSGWVLVAVALALEPRLMRSQQLPHFAISGRPDAQTIGPMGAVDSSGRRNTIVISCCVIGE